MLKKLIYTLIIISLYTNCVKTIKLETKKTKPKIVVKGVFHAGFMFSLSNSLSVLDRNDVKPITTAKIKIFDKNNNLLEEITNIGSGGNAAPYGTLPLEGEKYKVEISSPNYETVYAESYRPFKTEILNLTTVTKRQTNGKMKQEVTLTFQDRANQKDYYAITMHSTKYRIDTNTTTGIIDTVEMESVETRPYSFQAYFDENKNTSFSSILTFQDGLFNGKKQSVTFVYNLSDRYETTSKTLYRNILYFCYSF